MNFDELEKILQAQLEEQNHAPVEEFLGYSPIEMSTILYNTYADNSPIQLQTLSEEDCQRVPLLNLMGYLMHELDEMESIQLTSRGYLPPKIVKDMYQQGFLADREIELGLIKLRKENDALSINLTHNLAIFAGFAKKRKGVLSLTKRGEKIINNKPAMMKELFMAFAEKFNWAYYDLFLNEIIGQFGFGFSLILLSKYGKEKHLGSFYADLYLKAFPTLLVDAGQPLPHYSEAKTEAINAYCVRTFNRFLYYFGLVSLERTDDKMGYFGMTNYITTTDLFDRFVICQPSNFEHDRAKYTTH